MDTSDQSRKKMSRRDFFKESAVAATGLAVGGLLAGRSSAAAAPQPSRGRKGKRRIIDIHSHFLPEKWVTEISKRTRYPFLEKKSDDMWVITGSPQDKVPYQHQTTRSGFDVRSKLKEMDDAGVEISLLTLAPPGPDNAANDADRLTRIANDGLAEVVASRPERFRGIANLGYGNIEDSVRELRRCIDDLNFLGLQVYPYIGGKMPASDPALKPVWRVLQEKKKPLIFHPGSPLNPDYGNYIIGGLMGYWFDDAINLVRFILSGLLDEFPDLQVVIPHTWSLLPFLMDRLDYQVPRFSKGFTEMKNRKAPSEYLKKVYTDCINFSSDDFRYAVGKMGGVDYVMYGSDSPFIPLQYVVEVVEKSGLSSKDTERVFSGNARRLFGISI